MLIKYIIVQKSGHVKYLFGKMKTIGDRLKSERERLNISAANFATSGGVGRTVQYNYEKSISNPDAAYLEKVATLGVDVLYVITGQRAGDPVLKPDEAALLDNYRNSPEEGKRAIEATSSALAQRVAKGKTA